MFASTLFQINKKKLWKSSNPTNILDKLAAQWFHEKKTISDSRFFKKWDSFDEERNRENSEFGTGFSWKYVVNSSKKAKLTVSQ